MSSHLKLPSQGMALKKRPAEKASLAGGERGIRTPEGLTPLTVFKTAAFNRTLPSLLDLRF